MRIRISILISALACLLGGQLILAQTVELSKGTSLYVRITERLSSESNQTGDRFSAVLDEPLIFRERVIASEGTPVQGELLQVEDSGEVKGRARMKLTLSRIQINRHTHPLTTNQLDIRAEGTKGEDAKVIGGGAGIGAAIGAIIGGARGAAIGAAVGAGAGTAVVLTTEGEDVEFEPEQRFKFVLREDAELPIQSEPISFDRTESRESDDRDQRYRASREFRERAEALKFHLGDALAELESVEAIPLAERLELHFLVDSLLHGAESVVRLEEKYSLTRLDGVVKEFEEQFEKADRRATRSSSGKETRFWKSWIEVREDFHELANIVAFSDRVSVSTRGKLYWEGTVDERAYITLRSDDVQVQEVEGSVNDASFDLTAQLPRRPVEVELHQLRGRGVIELIEAPSRWNDYQLKVLVDDAGRGADQYAFEVEW